MLWRLDPGQIEVVDYAVAEILRRKQPWERLAMAFEANKMMRLVLKAKVMREHPDWAEQQVSTEVARRYANGTA